MTDIDAHAPGRVELLLGNEAIARGALEAGVGFISGYPGTPSSEIIPTIAAIAKRNNIYTEWAANEKVAMEAAAGASFSGIRSMAVMKQNGINVAVDFIGNLQMTGIKAGMVLLVADDPGPLSSSNEEDTRIVAKWMDFPLLEPCCAQEAKDMTKWAFEVSEQCGLICMVRTVSRIGHTRANVKLGELPEVEKKAYYTDTWNMYHPTKGIHCTVGGFDAGLHPGKIKKFATVKEIFAKAPQEFNWYTGPDEPELLIITSGVAYIYAKEALKILKLEDKVGILKLGTTWPLPEEIVVKHLRNTEKILFVEELEPFVERNVMELAASLPSEAGHSNFYGMRSGHMRGYGDVNVDLVIDAVLKIMGGNYEPRDVMYGSEIEELAKAAPVRPWELCPGCPYRPFFWTVKTALQIDGRDGFSLVDVGCYTLGAFNAGYWQGRTTHAMGSSFGVACGLGKLEQFGFSQPVMAMVGDSTFFHASIPALVSGTWNNANFIAVVMDNSATAMTGHQPHPGLPTTVMGDTASAISTEAVCRAMGCRVEVCDPFDMEATKNIILDLLSDDSGVKVLIVRRLCELVRARVEKKPPFKMHVDPEKCIGEDCGCARLCTRMFHCPGLMWDEKAGKAAIDEVMCAGCGVCADICPKEAIIKETLQE